MVRSKGLRSSGVEGKECAYENRLETGTRVCIDFQSGGEARPCVLWELGLKLRKTHQSREASTSLSGRCLMACTVDSLETCVFPRCVIKDGE